MIDWKGKTLEMLDNADSLLKEGEPEKAAEKVRETFRYLGSAQGFSRISTEWRDAVSLYSERYWHFEMELEDREVELDDGQSYVVQRLAIL